LFLLAFGSRLCAVLLRRTRRLGMRFGGPCRLRMRGLRMIRFGPLLLRFGTRRSGMLRLGALLRLGARLRLRPRLRLGPRLRLRSLLRLARLLRFTRLLRLRMLLRLAQLLWLRLLLRFAQLLWLRLLRPLRWSARAGRFVVLRLGALQRHRRAVLQMALLWRRRLAIGAGTVRLRSALFGLLL
jgi:hypothetical protein